METVCTTIACLGLINGLGYTHIQTNDMILYRTNNSNVVCVKNQSNYNCKPTNNFYNPTTD